ncbi:uncharacterized protein B0T15DRAFT_507647 [Chaetomium strumarium]|uniref:FAD-binding FR-type domain-containing protein n=1 Tax=Chaetomium strumarium TaxID=1170767 RepID=A0AAJ0H3X2_9PEZI|nr:hypothetical protein B0T15DRAFT_507647 [Chaetomium strumarium]
MASSRTSKHLPEESPCRGPKVRQAWTPEEDRLLSEAVAKGRNNKDCRKRWHYAIANTIRKGTWTEEEDDRLREAVKLYGGRWSRIAEVVGTRNGDQCWKRWYDCLDPRIDKSPWTADDDVRLVHLVSQNGRNWSEIVHQHFPNRTPLSAKNRYNILRRKQEGGLSRASSLRRADSRHSTHSSWTSTPSSSPYLSVPTTPSTTACTTPEPEFASEDWMTFAETDLDNFVFQSSHTAGADGWFSPEVGASSQPSLQTVDDSNPRSGNWTTANSATCQWPAYGFDSGSAALPEETASMATDYSWCYSQGQQPDIPFTGCGYNAADMLGCRASHNIASFDLPPLPFPSLRLAMDGTQACSRAQGALRDALPAFVRALCPGPAGTPVALGEGDNDWMKDPEKVEYIRQLIESIYEARAIVACYNLAMLLVLLMVTVWHWRESRRDREKWQQLRQCSGPEIDDGISSQPAAALSGTPAKVTSVVEDLDLERAPLLARNQATASHRKSKSSSSSKSSSAFNSMAIRSWLTRQPAPLPVVHRTLPSNGTSLFILAWLGLNVFFHFFRLPLRRDYFFIFADRAGLVFIVNLPLLYLLGAKNQPLRRLTGYSYEALNIFHRRVGELMCFEAAVHLAGMLLWQFVLSPEWLLASRTARAYFTHPLILCGIGALAAYELLYVTSLASVRQRWYELFLATHVVLQAAALAFLWFHFYTAQPYIALSLAIFLADRLVWRLCLKRAVIAAADLVILDKDTYTLSANWDIPPPPSSLDTTTSQQQQEQQEHPRRRCCLSWWWRRWAPSSLLPRNQSILHGWHPTDHVFLTVPSLGSTHALQAHPFTIASAAPGRHSTPSNCTSRPGGGITRTTTTRRRRERRRRAPHAWLTLLIRAHSGFTRDLLDHCISHDIYRLPVRLDGPYGSPAAQHGALSMLRASGCAVLVAGGSGIAVVFPLAWALLVQDHEDQCARDDDGKLFSSGGFGDETRRKTRTRKRKVHLLWVTHSREHREWVAGFPLQELVERGLELVIPEPTAEAGRPDVRGLVSGWIGDAAAEGREVGVVVSGPDGLNRAVRNVVADEIARGSEARVAVEKFGW